MLTLEDYWVHTALSSASFAALPCERTPSTPCRATAQRPRVMLTVQLDSYALFTFCRSSSRSLVLPSLLSKLPDPGRKGSSCVLLSIGGRCMWKTRSPRRKSIFCIPRFMSSVCCFSLRQRCSRNERVRLFLRRLGKQPFEGVEAPNKF